MPTGLRHLFFVFLSFSLPSLPCNRGPPLAYKREAPEPERGQALKHMHTPQKRPSPQVLALGIAILSTCARTHQRPRTPILLSTACNPYYEHYLRAGSTAAALE